MTKTCKTCARAQKGFFCPRRLYCGTGREQMREVEPDGCCDWWEEKEDKE